MSVPDLILDIPAPAESPKKASLTPLEAAYAAERRAKNAVAHAEKALTDARAAYGQAVGARMSMEAPAIGEDGAPASDLDRRTAAARVAAALAATGDQARMAQDGLRKRAAYKRIGTLLGPRHRA